jgi:uncharacterized protein YggU (UPF0235/DUF167 family)
MLVVRREGERVSFTIRVTPRASANAVGGERDGALLVRVSAPPVDGQANDTVVEVVAKALDLPRSAVRLQRGAAARTKRVSVPLAAEAAVRRLAK